MQTVYIVIMEWIDEDKEFASSISAVFSTLEKAASYHSLQEFESPDYNFRIEVWEVK